MSASPRILVVDDEKSMQEFLEIFFRSEGYSVATEGSVAGARRRLESDPFDVVITDLHMPDGTGLDVLEFVKETSPETISLVITAFGSTESAIAAMKQGAYDYITKPFKMDEMRLVVAKALERKYLSSENRRLHLELRNSKRSPTIIGNSAALRPVFELIRQVADTRANVLITGESGTGKEVVARAIHEGGGRHAKPFVVVNCAAIPETLLESELFGHVRGAFTGAVQNRAGLFEEADQGTIFLDEIGEIPLPVQVKLLRVIQEKSFRRVGGSSDQQVDVRILAATNRNLAEDVRAGRFREDLYYRLNVIEIRLPPLRSRSEDIDLLIRHFIEKYSAEFGRTVRDCTPAARRLLHAHDYPGNVRELENLIERAVALTRGDEIDLDALPANFAQTPRIGSVPAIPADGFDLERALEDYERGLILAALGPAGGVKKRAAKLLGISFRSLRYRMVKLGIADPEGERSQES